MVMNVGALLDGDYKCVARDVMAVRDACREEDNRIQRVKVILETCLLSDAQIVDACILCAIADADFVKTSTGFSHGGATIYHVSLMQSVSVGLEVKASGGIRSYADALDMVRHGATRLGTSRGVELLAGGGGGDVDEY